MYVGCQILSLQEFHQWKPSFYYLDTIIGKYQQNYGEYLIGNIDELPDQDLNDLLSDVLRVTRGDIFSLGRFGAIWRLNTGYYSDIDFSKYLDLDLWIPMTSKIEKITLSDWESGIEPDELPPRFHENVKKFTGNLLIESEKPGSADGIWLFLDYSYKYNIYINGELTFPGIHQKWYHCNGLVLDLLNIKEINSVYLEASGLEDFVTSEINRIRFIKLLSKEEMKEIDPFDCKFEPYIRRN